jgi:large subunit ribosomal protein L24
LALKDPKTGKATKVGFKIEKDGTKNRISRLSGEVI